MKYFLGGEAATINSPSMSPVNIPAPTCTSIAPCVEVKRSLNTSALGGYVSLGVDLAVFRTESGWEWRLRLEDKIHRSQLWESRLLTRSWTLSGPINVLQVGMVAGFRTRHQVGLVAECLIPAVLHRITTQGNQDEASGPQTGPRLPNKAGGRWQHGKKKLFPPGVNRVLAEWANLAGSYERIRRNKSPRDTTANTKGIAAPSRTSAIPLN